MNIEEKYTLIEKYLAGELTGSALEEFEKQLSEDSELKEELNLHRQLTETLSGEKVHQFREVLENTDQNWEAPDTQQKAKVVSIQWGRILTIAATVLLFAIGVYWWTNVSISGEDLYANYFEPYPMVLNQRSLPKGSDNDKLINDVVSAYNQQDFNTANKALKQLQTIPTEENISFLFYDAITLLADGKGDAAIPILEKILQQPDHLFVEQSRWYLALAYLNNDNTAKAKILLQDIQDGQYQYANTQKILEHV